uniref:syntaxin-binding protein 6-like n=1 Tax=Styela clava TaxID=7725 RepID=UPI001939DEAB|nr:syntaxin-binding protein 6-like [Styela clava]
MANCKTVQDVKHWLHSNVFHPRKERILGFIQVSKTEPSNNPFKKKENRHYLCLYVTSSRPYQAFIERFIKSEDGASFEKRRHWCLEELTKVDGKGEKSNNLELWFEGEFKFEASNSQEKSKFISDVADACKKYLDKAPPEFVNVDSKTNQVIEKAASDISQLQKTRQELGERGEKLNDLDVKTAEMAHSAEKFAENASKLADKYQ